MFKLNDKVIYPGHGVAVVEEIAEKRVGESVILLLKLAFLFKDMTILVPLYNANSVGIRYPSEPDVVALAMMELTKQPTRKLESIDFTPSGWNRRHKDYQARIQGGQLIEIAKIYRDLMHVAQQKDLSFGERTLLQTTEELLLQEMQVILNKDRDYVIQELRSPFKQFIFYDRGFGTPQEGASSQV